MSGLKRYTLILRLFDEEQRSLTVPEMAEITGSPASSVYRHVRELLAEGFLESTVDSRYRLGPIFIHFSRRVRITDPLLRAGVSLIEGLVEQVRLPCNALLCRLYGNQVMCVALCKSPEAQFVTSYQYGRPMPLLSGATSTTVLARMPARALNKLLDNVGATDQHRADLARSLEQIRRQGYGVMDGDVDDGLRGIAAGIHSKELGINASISLIGEAATLTPEYQNRVLPLLLSTASVINGLLEEQVGVIRERKRARIEGRAQIET